jgi:uncharacterized protein YndB with AHSA1/START domain
VKPIEREIWIDAPRDLVFDYFVDAKKLTRWMGAHAELQPFAGGQYLVAFKEGWVSRGEFVLVSKPDRIVYTVGWEGNAEFPPGSTRVEITLHAERGGTRLMLRHFGPPPEGLEKAGWGQYLERLAAVASGRTLPDDPFDLLAEHAGQTRH